MTEQLNWPEYKNHRFDYIDLCWQGSASVFNMLTICVIVCLLKISLLILWLQSLFIVILEPKNIKSHCFYFFTIYLPWNDRTECHDLSFCWILSQVFYSPLSHSSRDSLGLCFLPLEWYHLHIWIGNISLNNLDSNLCFMQPSISDDVLCI